MSYEVLARRWRPKTFDDVYGQSHVTTTLRNALRSGKLPHALLFAGPRGVGKTSIARILACALNCEQGPTETPCGNCAPCTEIAASNSLDVQEVDAASHTGVDNVREIIESIRYSAGPGKHRIFIIDEVHMLSPAAFNALLKTLEEPPPNSLFILATTDPNRIPATVRSRVQRFDLKRLPAADLLARLQEIVKQEQIEVPESVLRALVREGDGSGRDALTLLDRLVSGLGNEISEAAAAAVLDLVDRRVLWEILDPVLAGDPAAALVATRTGLDRGIEPARLAADLLTELRHLLVARLVPDPAELIDLAPEEVAELGQRAAEHSAETYQRLFRALLTRLQDLPYAPRPGHALELAVARLATLPEAESIAELVARLEALGAGGPPPAGGGGGPGGDGGRAPSSGRARSAATQRPTRSREPSAPRAETLEPTPPEPSRPAQEPAASAPTLAAQEPPPDRDEPPPGDERPPSDRDLVRLRNEAKQHPAVRNAIEILDAELRDVRREPRP